MCVVLVVHSSHCCLFYTHRYSFPEIGAILRFVQSGFLERTARDPVYARERMNRTVIIPVRIREDLGDEVWSAPSELFLLHGVTCRWRFIFLLSLFTVVLIVVVTHYFVKYALHCMCLLVLNHHSI